MQCVQVVDRCSFPASQVTRFFVKDAKQHFHVLIGLEHYLLYFSAVCRAQKAKDELMKLIGLHH